MLAEMREHDEGFYHHAQRMSKHHNQYYKNHLLSADKVKFFENMTSESLAQQSRIESEDKISFDEYLENYFNESNS